MPASEPIGLRAADLGTRRVVAWTFSTHAAALTVVFYELAGSGSPLLLVLGLAFAAIVAATTIQLVSTARTRNDAYGANIYLWNYGVTALLCACAAGAAVAVLALVASILPIQLSKITIPALVALAMFDLYQTLEAARLADWNAQSRLATDDPMRATTIVLLTASMCASLAAAAALVLAMEFSQAEALLAAGWVDVLALGVSACVLSLQFSKRLASASVSEETRRRLLITLDKAAMQTGAIRAISGLEASYIAPRSLRVVLRVDFKDGVSAQHIGPVLERLKLAAIEDVADVVDVVLASPLSQAL